LGKPNQARALDARLRFDPGEQIPVEVFTISFFVAEQTQVYRYRQRALDATRLRAAIYKEIEGQPMTRKPMIDPHATESTESVM